MGKPLRIGLVGCGVISRQYLDTARRLDAIEIVAAADLRPERSAALEASDGIRARVRVPRTASGLLVAGVLIVRAARPATAATGGGEDR